MWPTGCKKSDILIHLRVLDRQAFCKNLSEILTTVTSKSPFDVPVDRDSSRPEAQHQQSVSETSPFLLAVCRSTEIKFSVIKNVLEQYLWYIK